MGNAPVTPTTFHLPTTAADFVFWIGLVLTIVLWSLRIKAALVISILLTTVIALIAGVATIPADLVLTPSFTTLGHVDPFEIFSVPGISLLAAILIIFSIMLTDFFDTMGTVTGVAAEAGLANEDGSVPGVGRILLVDSLAAAVGGLAGVSSNTTYIESAAGVAEGGRTGFTSIVTGVLFLLAILLAPIAGIIPGVATAPALVLVGYLMFTQVKGIDVTELEDGIPALLTMILMPLTYDITVGIGAGFVSWVLIKVVKGKASEVHPLMWVVVGACSSCSSSRTGSSPSASRRRRRPPETRPGATSRPAVRPMRGRPPVGRFRATIHPMFHRTELPDGPRVISARLPGSRSVSIAAYVLAGSRLETPAEAGVAHFMEHLTFKGTAGYPSSRAISEAVEGVGGSANAATDRESTVYWARVPRREAETAMRVLGELVVRPRLDEEDIDQERTVIVEEIRSYLDDPSEYAQMLIQQAMFGEGTLGREICGDEAGHPVAAERGDPRLLARDVPPVEHGGGGRRRPRARRGGLAGVGGVRPGQRHDPGVRARAGAPRRPAGPHRPPRHVAGAALDRRPGAPPRPPRRVEPRGPQRGAGRRDVVPAVPRACARRRASPTTSRRGSWSTRTPARSRCPRASTRARSRRRSTRSSLELTRLADEEVPVGELAKAKAYLSGGLELRMDDTRHLASWIGGQEALHDRVYTLDDALAAVEAVRPEEIRRLAGELFHDEALRMAVVAPAKHLRGLDAHLRLSR